MTTSNVGKMSQIRFYDVPDTWSLCFQFEQEVICSEVSEDIYNKSEIGQSHMVGYGVGRIDGKYILKSIQ